MTQTVTPMFHVPDVRATAEWYSALGFEVLRTNEDCGEMNWALLSFRDSMLMLSSGGAPSTAHRRDVDLYIHIDGLDALFERLRGHGEVVEPPHDTEYGMREFILRDLNRFWITFGEEL
jgi:uncharacterized glyoxalase superfamily protein PhnB